jgi:hypothetical protein
MSYRARTKSMSATTQNRLVQHVMFRLPNGYLTQESANALQIVSLHLAAPYNSIGADCTGIY